MKQPLKVLLVEDDAWLAELEAATLEKAGYTVGCAPDALTAIDMVDTFQPDCLVLDVLLAGSTAFALLNELRSYEDTAGLPIVLCTNMAEQLQAVDIAAYGVKKVVDKTTMQPDDIAKAVQVVCSEVKI